MARHRIGKSVIQFETGSDSDALRQQEIFSRVWNRMLPRIEALFEKWAGGEEVTAIDKLELDLGDLDAASLESELEEKILQALEESLARHLGPSQNGKSRIPIAVSDLGGFLFFLERGYLPWSSEIPAQKSWEESLLVHLEKGELDKLQQSGHTPVETIRELLHRSKIARQRLSQQFSISFQLKLLMVLEPQSGKVFTEAFWDWIEQVDKLITNQEKRFHQIELMERASAAVAEKENSEQRLIELSELLVKINSTLSDLNKRDRAKLSEIPSDNETPGSWPWLLGFAEATEIAARQGKEFPASDSSEAIGKEEEIHGKEAAQSDGSKEGKDTDSTEEPDSGDKKMRSEPLPGNEGRSKGKGLAEEGSESLEGMPEGLEGIAEGLEAVDKMKDATKPGEETAETHLQEPDLAEVSGDEIYLGHAGVVLVHAFLPTYFESLGWVKKKAFVSEDVRAEALLALHYLATDEREAPEYQMPLYKILCGLPINVSIRPAAALSIEAAAEAEKLLVALIANWGALKKTSPDGLRDGFFDREGRLRHKASGWHLQVEQKAQDILLDQLPWNLSMIQLPWMKEMLRVDWR